MTLRIETDTQMPPFGVAEALIDTSVVQQPDLFQFWLLTHSPASALGAAFWRTAVLRECLPDPVGDLEFVALAPVERIVPRTALVRVAVGAAL